MDIEDVRNFCLSLPATSEGLPFDEHTLVFKVVNKIFLFLPLDELPTLTFSVKNNPEKIAEYLEEKSFARPAFHLNKKHWMAIFPDASLSTLEWQTLIKESYLLVAKGLKKEDRLFLASLLDS